MLTITFLKIRISIFLTDNSFTWFKIQEIQKSIQQKLFLLLCPIIDLLVLFLSSLLIRSFSKYFSERFCFAVLLDVSLVEEKCEEKEAFNDLMFKFQSFSVPLSLCCDFYHHFLAFEFHLWYLKPQRGRRMINAFLLLE